jgi:hypothetical protein
VCRIRTPAALPKADQDGPRKPTGNRRIERKISSTSKAHKPEPDQHEKARRRSDEEPPLYDVHDPIPSRTSYQREILHR